MVNIRCRSLFVSNYVIQWLISLLFRGRSKCSSNLDEVIDVNHLAVVEVARGSNWHQEWDLVPGEGLARSN